MSQRKQKNLRLGTEYHEQLEELAEEWFNSRKKQGQVVERLLDLHSDSSMEGKIDAIYEHVVQQNGENNSTHTENEEGSNNGKSEAERIEEIAEEQDTLDLDEVDLTEVKGARGVDKGLIFYKVIENEYGQTKAFSKSDVRNIIQEESGYGYNGANQIANSVLSRCSELPDKDDKLNQISGRDHINDANDYFDECVLYDGTHTTTEQNRREMINFDARELRNNSKKSRRKSAKRIASWLEDQVDQ